MASETGLRSITLHIGTEKTGTTTIQRTCASNRQLLANAGILYPVLPGIRNHVGLTYFAAGTGDRPPPPWMLGLSKADLPGYVETFLDKLREEIAAGKCAHLLFSNEHLSSRLRSVESVSRLANAMRSLADTVKVVIYFRPQYELYPSSYSTAVKSGETEIRPPPQKLSNHFYNYNTMLTIWEAAFGIENIVVRRFGRAYFKDGDLISDFFDAVGMPVPAGMQAAGSLNQALDSDALAFLRIANGILPPDRDPETGRERFLLIKALEEFSRPGAPIVPSKALCDIDTLYGPSNQEVAGRYFAGEKAPLFKPYSEAKDHTVAELTVEKSVEIALRLLKTASAVSKARGTEHHDGKQSTTSDGRVVAPEVRRAGGRRVRRVNVAREQ